MKRPAKHLPRPLTQREIGRFVQRAVPAANGCIEWTGNRTVKGYGRLQLSGQHYLAHRVIWEALNGPIPDDLMLDHLCRNKSCVNVAHLEPVTNWENTRRGANFVGRSGVSRVAVCRAIDEAVMAQLTGARPLSTVQLAALVDEFEYHAVLACLNRLHRRGVVVRTSNGKPPSPVLWSAQPDVERRAA